MNIIELKERSADYITQLVDVWEASVKETHTFLSDKEIETIKAYIPQALEAIAHLIVVENKEQHPIAFMGIQQTTLEMLFISPQERGKGVGKQLFMYGREHFAMQEVCVNEQNPLAKGFYEHLGFQVYDRSDVDEQGSPYPILYMRLQ